MEFSTTKITPNDNVKIPSINGDNAGYMETDELKEYVGDGLITQSITDGDTSHAPSGDAVNGALNAITIRLIKAGSVTCAVTSYLGSYVAEVHLNGNYSVVIPVVKSSNNSIDIKTAVNLSQGSVYFISDKAGTVVDYYIFGY